MMGEMDGVDGVDLVDAQRRTVVVGPPAAGKTRYVLAEMRRGELVMDFDHLVAALTLRPLYDKPAEALGRALDVRRFIVEEIRPEWVISSTPAASYRAEMRALGYEVVVLETAADVCLERIQADARRDLETDWEELIRRWWEHYEPDERDQRIGGEAEVDGMDTVDGMDGVDIVDTDTEARRKVEETERRVYELTGLELRADGDAPEIAGYAAVFNQRSHNLGGFVEAIRPGAFARTLAADPDVRATIEHEGGLMTIGRTTNGTLALWEDENGLAVRIKPPDTQAGRDAVTLVRGGFVNQMSFMFRVEPGGDEWTRTEEGTPFRWLKEVNLEHGDVTLSASPAYPQTSAVARSRAEALGQAAAALETESKGDGSPGARARDAARLRLQIEMER